MSRRRGANRALSAVTLLILALSGILLAFPNAAVFGQPPGVVMMSSPNSQTGGNFGQSVSVGSTGVIVGAPFETVAGFTGAGRAYLYNATAGGAAKLTLVSPNAQSYGEFGYSVAISGDVAVVGAPGETSGGVAEGGRAYIFSVSTGTLLFTLNKPNTTRLLFQFGYSVAVSGNVVVVGAPDAAGCSSTGGAFVYSAITGALTESLNSTNPVNCGDFGESVSIDGNNVVVGAPGEWTSVPFSPAGRVYVFDATTGALTQDITSPSGSNSALFGQAVAVNASTAVVGQGAIFYTNLNPAFTFDITTGAATQTFMTVNNPSFGQSVAIGAGGTLAVMGTPQFSLSSGLPMAGIAGVYTVSSGALVYPLISPNAQSDGAFGTSVSMNGNIVCVGAPGESQGGDAGAGHVYCFDLLVVVTCGKDVITVGQAVSCSARFAHNSNTGSINWAIDGPGKLNKQTCNLSKATCSIRFTSTSADPSLIISASYSGDKHNPPSFGTISLNVTARTSTTRVTCSPGSVVAGSSRRVKCTAKVTGYTPTGTVTFSQSSTNGGSFTFASSDNTCTISKGRCSVTMSGEAPGTVAIQASYSGDLNNTRSSSNTINLRVTG